MTAVQLLHRNAMKRSGNKMVDLYLSARDLKGEEANVRFRDVKRCQNFGFQPFDAQRWVDENLFRLQALHAPHVHCKALFVNQGLLF